MLQHQQEEPTGYVSPISNLRVTPQELAQAVAAIESRREGTNADTIAIGDAIEQLGLSVSAQEVYAEIRRQQAAQQQTAVPIATPAVGTKKRRRLRMVLLGGVIGASLIGNLVALTTPSSMRETPYPASGMTTPAIAEAHPVIEDNPIKASEVTEEHPGYAKLDQVYELATGRSPKTVELRTAAHGMETGDAQWKIIKMNDKYWVRGWTHPSGSFEANNQNILGDTSNLFSQNGGDGSMNPRTVPIENFAQIHDPAWVINGVEGVSVATSGK